MVEPAPNPGPKPETLSRLNQPAMSLPLVFNVTAFFTNRTAGKSAVRAMLRDGGLRQTKCKLLQNWQNPSAATEFSESGSVLSSTAQLDWRKITLAYPETPKSLN